MKFRKIDRSGHSPAMYGKSFRAMFAESLGAENEYAMAKRTGLPRTICRELFCSDEWHHVDVGGRIVKAQYGDAPTDRQVRRARLLIRLRARIRRLEKLLGRGSDAWGRGEYDHRILAESDRIVNFVRRIENLYI